MKISYFEELTINLRREGLIVCPQENDLLPVRLDSKSLCLITERGGVGYWKKDADDDSKRTVLDKVTAGGTLPHHGGTAEMKAIIDRAAVNFFRCL